MDIYEKKDMDELAVKQINHLFIEGYTNYHYKKLLTVKGFSELLENPYFDCIYIKSEEDVIGFAGYYLYPDEEPVRVMLSHLLLNSSFRGNGLGKVLENERLNKVNEKVTGAKVVYASCVEKPIYSVEMKLNHGFTPSGFRWRYRRGDAGRDNAVIMVSKECSKVYDNVQIAPVSAYTKNLIRLINVNIQFRQELDSEVYTYKYTKEYFNQADRVIFRLQLSEDGKKMEEIIKEAQQEEQYYVSFHIIPSIMGMSNIDECLIRNRFFPLAYLPNVYHGYGELEYQLLKNGYDELLEDDTVSIYGKKLISCIFSNERKVANEESSN